MTKINLQKDSSEKESNKEIIENNDINKKRRGRPKNKTIQTKQQVKIFESESENELSNEEIILDLPIHSDTNSLEETNCFTMKESDNQSKNKSNHMASFEISSEKSCEKITIEEITKQYKKQELIINQLKNNIKDLKNVGEYENIITATKDIKKTINDLNLISIKDGKTVIVDKTNIACWWCSYNFDTLPVFLPDKYTLGAYYVCGCFCSFSCAKAYNDNDLDDARTQIRNSLLKKLYNTIFNNDKFVPTAPKWELLTKFGGKLSIEEFRNTNTICLKEYKYIIPPLIPLIPMIEETSKEKIFIKQYYKDTDNNDNDIPKISKISVISKDKIEHGKQINK